MNMGAKCFYNGIPIGNSQVDVYALHSLLHVKPHQLVNLTVFA